MQIKSFKVMKKLLFLLLLVFTCSTTPKLYAQDQSLRTELPSLLWGNINIDYGVAVSPKLSIHIPVFIKPFTLGLPVPVGAMLALERFNTNLYQIDQFDSMQHYLHLGIEPGVRYWFNGVHFRGLYLGAHALAKIFRYGGHRLESSYKEGWAIGGFASIGYSYELASRWNIEFELGLGGQYRSYTRYTLSGQSFTTGTDFVPSISRLGVQVVYLL